MTLLDRVKTRTGSDLPDSELQAMIDAIMAEIAARLGPAGLGAIEVELGDPADPESRVQRTLRVHPPIDTARSLTVTELDPGDNGQAAAETVLDAQDFRVMHGGRTLQRLTGGPNGAAFWAPLVRLAYTPLGTDGAAAAADEATIKLIQLDLSFRGLIKSERAGDYQFTLSDDPVALREAILNSLVTPSGMVLG